MNFLGIEGQRQKEKHYKEIPGYGFYVEVKPFETGVFAPMMDSGKIKIFQSRMEAYRYVQKGYFSKYRIKRVDDDRIVEEIR